MLTCNQLVQTNSRPHFPDVIPSLVQEIALNILEEVEARNVLNMRDDDQDSLIEFGKFNRVPLVLLENTVPSKAR